MAAPTTSPPPRRPSGWSRARRVLASPMVQFIGAGTLAVLVVGWSLSVASRRVGEREAIVEARSEALVKGQGIVEPLLTDDALTGPGPDRDALHDTVHELVLDESLVRVKVWSRDGEILFSDDEAQIGGRFELGEDELEALDEGLVDAEVSDLDKPENVREQDQGRLLEVYLPLTTPSGEEVLFEAYFRYDAVIESGDRIWRSIAPIAIGALVVLELVQIPLAWSLARRLRARQDEREQLLQRAIDASEHERRRIAQDLHDGVVQDLAGVSYSLAAMGRGDRDPAEEAERIDAAAATVRASVEALRTLLVELYPPNLEQEGLAPALDDLLARVRSRGIDATLDAPEDVDLPLPATRLVYRVAQEALRNVVTHAGATAVEVVVATGDGDVRLSIRDDGVGFDIDEARASAADGHLGLLGLGDLAERAGGTLRISSTPGQGTTVDLEVPVP
ncbi:MAG: sensor histidine kinase [Actinobacteria bacterium]|nr:sensor histidine kinase [Actinomycetota bacterium]